MRKVLVSLKPQFLWFCEQLCRHRSMQTCTQAKWQSTVILFYSTLGCGLPLQEVTLGQSPPTFCPLLSLFTLLHIAPQYHLSNGALVCQLIVHPLSATNLLLIVPFIIFHSGNVSSPIPFHTGYVLDYACHSGVSCQMMNQTYERLS